MIYVKLGYFVYLCCCDEVPVWKLPWQGSSDMWFFCGWNFSFLKFDYMILIDSKFRYCRFFRLGETYMMMMMVMFFNFSLNWMAGLTSVNLATLTRNAIYPWCPQPKIFLDWSEGGDLPWWLTNTSDVGKLASSLLSQPNMGCMYGKEQPNLVLSQSKTFS